jgi:hypothetical protein
MFVLIGIGTVLMTEEANAKADHKTFVKCANKWAPSVFSILDTHTQKFMEERVLSGNMTGLGNYTMSLVGPIYDCVWGLANPYPPPVDLNK